MIDITAITNTMENVISGWKVSKRHSNSDHNLIEFSLKATEPETKYKTTMRQEQKKAFTKDLDNFLYQEVRNLAPKHINVRSVKDLATTLINGNKAIESKNSNTHKITAPKRDLVWEDPKVK